MLRKHPLVYKLIDWFRKEQTSSEKKLIQVRTGVKPRRKPAYIALDERLVLMVSKYNKNKCLEFLSDMSLQLTY